MLSKQPKVALVHDDFTQTGGAESLFATIASIYPDVPIYTSLVNWKKIPASIDKERIRTSFMQKIPFATKFYKLLLPLYPLAFESFDFNKYDLVISSTTRFSKSIITKPQTNHICYINSTPRFLWNKKAKDAYLPKPLALLLTPYFIWLKRWDIAASSRVDYYIANSQNIKKEVKKTYGFESDIVYPFADTDFFNLPKIHNWELKSKNYHLVVSRLVKWKKIDIAINASKNLSFNLIIVGDGPDKKRLKDLAGNDENIEFYGKVSRKTLKELYQNSQGLIVTQEEDFGIAAVEAQACGVPVIAYKKGGQNDIIKDKITGIFFNSQIALSLQGAILVSSKVKWRTQTIRKNALRFSKDIFVKSLKAKIKTYAS